MRKNNNILKRILSFVLIMMMLGGLLPTTAFAEAETIEEIDIIEQKEEIEEPIEEIVELEELSAVETPTVTKDIYLSVSHDNKFFRTDEGEIMALKEISVPYFDLSLYGLEQYYFVSEDYGEGETLGEATDYTGKVTMLHALIYATEVYYCGIDPKDAGQGYLYDENLIGTDAFSPEGAAGSMYIRKFWGMDENFNYYHNYRYPLASEGWGSTADQILLKDGDVVTVGHFTSWDFHLDSLSVFNFIKAGDDIIQTTVKQGEEVEVTVVLAGKGGNYSTAHLPMADRDVFITPISEMTAIPTQWNMIGSTDENGNVLIDTSYLEPGQYFVGTPGEYGNEYTKDICSTPGGIILNVEGELEKRPEEVTVGVPESTKVQKWGYNSLKISWDKVDNADGYQLYFCGSDGKWKSAAQIEDADTTAYIHTGLITGTTYTYRVRAYRVDGGEQVFGEYSSEGSGKPVPKKAVIAKTAKWGYNAIKVSWNKVSGASGYRLYYREQGTSSWKYVTQIGKGSTLSYIHKGVTSGKVYEYRMRAYRTVAGEKVFGAYSDIMIGRTTPGQVQITSVKKASATNIKLTWKKVAGASGYRIYYREAGTNTWKYVTQIGKGSTISYTHKGLRKGKTYEYHMRAYKTVEGEKVFGSYSSAKTLKLK